MHWWRAWLAGVLAVVALAAAACTSNHRSSHDPTTPASATPTSRPPTTSASPTVTPTPSRTGPVTTGPNVRPGEKPPVLIAEAKQHNPTGALFFADYYMKAKDWSLATMDTYLLKQIEAPSCKTCTRWNAIIDGYAKRGAYAKGGRLTIGDVKLVSGQWDVKSDYVVDIKFTQAAGVIVLKNAPPSTEVPRAEPQGSIVFVSWIGHAWKIMEEEADS